ncbi:helix-turn-helix transcriptional regulator [Salmonella enterica subsp. enterica]|nr:AraC family transcriptional regulator [Salmonella enterica subsp. enterica serovar Caracas]ECH8695544.1 AraC family transcriptional regulator [Salmonella enterica subsp. enterica]EDT6969924.1 helix-turn-helix transcriptional regulator [Salmonella enterica subsp. enterica]EHH5277014.1 helix-turn-helix transcriptional regulator [Salmonella enterica]EHH6370244.1 helix-turn-helix transcriptional regulator [Salmonella enterica]
MSPISCHSSVAPAMKKIFSVSDFIAFGERYGIDYRFPALPQYTQSSPVLHGDIEEIALPGGICITRSDVHVLQPYETTSRHSSPLYMLVVLEGNVALAVNEQTFLLSAGMAFCSQLSEQQTIRAHHGADSKLRTLSLGMYPDGGWRERLPVSLADEWERSAASARVWQVPEFLLSGLRYAQQPGTHAASRQLMLEGIMLQLLGYALNLCQPATQKRGLPVTGEYQRLELIRRLLEQTPEKAYTLNELAHRAAMSPSSLRCKFRHAYGCTVFDYLRDCRLARARRYLMEGYSVQQAAWMSGYQHATNFATAFRRRYGCSPGELRDASLTASRHCA